MTDGRGYKFPRGEAHPLSRVSDDEAREMQQLASQGWTQRAIAAKFGRAQSTVSYTLRCRCPYIGPPQV